MLCNVLSLSWLSNQCVQLESQTNVHWFDSVSVGCVVYIGDSVSVGCVVYIGLTQSQLVVLCTLV